MLKKLTVAVATIAALTASASASTFIFEGFQNNVTPEGVLGVDFVDDCATGGALNDFCSADSAAGLNYLLDGIELNVTAFEQGDVIANDDGTFNVDLGIATRLIQDRTPSDSGLGAFSEDNSSDDQTQFDSGESIVFDFGENEFLVTDVEFNAGGDVNCTTNSEGQGEGPCGEFLLQIFDLDGLLTLASIIDITNTDVLATLGTGARFVLTALTPGGGFSVARLTVSDVPIPGALPLLISGIAGLGFASRKKKKAA